MRAEDYQWTVDGPVLSCWDCETKLFSVVVDTTDPPPLELQQALISAYFAGREDGERHGRHRLQYELRRLLDINGG